MQRFEYFIINDLQRFEYLMEEGEPVFLFRVCEGGAETSFALQVAAASGLQARTVDRARQVMDAIMVTMTISNHPYFCDLSEEHK